MRVFSHAPQVGLADVAPGGRVRLDALARWLQDAAWADVVDSGIEDDGVWIVRRLELLIERFPRFGERATVETACSGAAKLWAERRSTVHSDGGGRVEAVALWVHLDANGRPRPLPPGFDAVYGAAAAGRRPKARLHHPAAPPAGATQRPWRFRAAELDLAGHVNNAAYWQVLEEELVGGEPRDAATYEIEHRAAAGAGEATVHSVDGLRWIADAHGAVVATLRAP
jgi:acyl-ACP thioesterase